MIGSCRSTARSSASLAETHTVVRYDRLGTGLSDRDAVGATIDAELTTVVDALELDESRPARRLLWRLRRAHVRGRASAARQPRSPSSVGSPTATAIAPKPLREALAATVRAHWGAGLARAPSDIWLPGAQRTSCATASRSSSESRPAPKWPRQTLERIYAIDLRDQLQANHRAGARYPPARGPRDPVPTRPRPRRRAAERAARPRLAAEFHLPWLGASAHPLLAALHDFLDDDTPAAPPADSPLSAREQEVLRLVSAGLADAEIAVRLVVSPHTVHRHVANIRTKLGQPSRAAAVAYAARRGLDLSVSDTPRRSPAGARSPACRASAPRRIAATRKPESPTSSSVGWLHRQPAANARHGGASRSCHAGASESARHAR